MPNSKIEQARILLQRLASYCDFGWLLLNGKTMAYFDGSFKIHLDILNRVALDGFPYKFAIGARGVFDSDSESELEYGVGFGSDHILKMLKKFYAKGEANVKEVCKGSWVFVYVPEISMWVSFYPAYGKGYILRQLNTIQGRRGWLKAIKKVPAKFIAKDLHKNIEEVERAVC